MNYSVSNLTCSYKVFNRTSFSNFIYNIDVMVMTIIITMLGVDILPKSGAQ